MYGNPEYYRIIFDYKLPKDLFDLPHDVAVVCFTNGDLAEPAAEPICIYHYAGIRRYLWADKSWSEYSISWDRIRKTAAEILTTTNDLEDALACQKILDLANNQQNFRAPNIGDNRDDSEPMLFVRTIYEIEN